MPNMRRGTTAACARAAAGAIAFRSGRARLTPAPRSSVRRGIACLVYPLAFKIAVPFPSFALEEIAFHNAVYDAAGSVARRTGFLQYVFHLFAVHEADGRAGGVSRKLADEVSRDGLLFMIEQELFEFADIVEGSAVGKDPGGIHGQAVVEGEALTREADAWFRLDAFGERAVAIAPAAHDVEAFEREAGRINLAMAGSADRVGAMTIKLLAYGDGAPDIWFDGGHAGRLNESGTEDALHDPDPSDYWRGGGAVGRHLEHARLGQQAAADGVFRECNPAHCDSGNAGYAVVLRKAFVEEGEIGINNVARRK